MRCDLQTLLTPCDRVVVFSQRPGRIKKIFTIDLPRPRQIESYAVVDLSRAIMAELRDDVVSSERDTETKLLRELEERMVGDDTL